MGSNIPQFQEIANFVEGLRFKKTAFGANLEDVYACMQDLNAMYTDTLTEVQKGQLTAEEELRERLAEKDNRIERLSAELEAIRRAEKSATDTLYELQGELELQRREGRDKFDIAAEALAEMAKNKQTTIAQADREARAIIVQAKTEADKLLAEARQQIAKEQRQGQDYLAELEQLRLAAKQTLELVYSDFAELTEGVAQLREKTDSLTMLNAKSSGIKEIGNMWKAEGHETA